MTYIIGIDPSAVDTAPAFELGSVGRTADGKLYKYIVYSEEAAAVDAVAGEVAYYVAGDTTGYTVTSDLSASCSVGAGVLQANLSNGEYGWVQVSGLATLSIALTAGADGNALTPVGAGDGTLDVSAAATDSICAHAVDASENIIMCAFPH